MWEGDLLGCSNGGQFHMREGPPGIENRSHKRNSTPGAFAETAGIWSGAEGTLRSGEGRTIPRRSGDQDWPPREF